MNKNTKIVISAIVAVVMVYALITRFSGKGEEANVSPSPEASASVSPTVSAIVSPSVTGKPTSSLVPTPTKISVVQSPVPRNLITGPATCQLSGSIRFINPTLYETIGAKMVYTNIDDSSRLIYWSIVPNDGSMEAGPNIFANIRPLPNGEKQVDVTPTDIVWTAKNYEMTAYVTYGEIQADSSEIVKTANCTGKVTVTVP